MPHTPNCFVGALVLRGVAMLQTRPHVFNGQAVFALRDPQHIFTLARDVIASDDLPPRCRLPVALVELLAEAMNASTL